VDLGDVSPSWYPGYDLLNRVVALSDQSAAAREAALPRPDDPSNCWPAYWSILATPWFTRLWILQEIVLARSCVVMYGRYSFPWERWEKSFDMLCSSPTLRDYMEQSGRLGHGFGNFLKILDIRNSYLLFRADKSDPGAALRIRQIGFRDLRRLLSEGPYDALKLVSLARELECAEPKDRIFALAALMNDSELSAIGDYSLPAVEIYTRFARYQVQRGNLFAILDVAGLAKHKNPQHSLPSWVPDWTSQRVLDGALRPLSVMRNLPYAASGQGTRQPPDVKILDGGLVISHQAMILDTIRDVHGQKQRELGGTTTGPVTELASFLRWVESIQQMIAGSTSVFASLYPDIDDALARLLIIDDQYTGTNAVVWSVPINDPAAELKKAIKLLRSRLHDTSDQVSSVSRSSTETYIHQMKAATRWRSFAVTDTGLIVLVPEVAMAGDKVAIFRGAAVPYILRQLCPGGYVRGSPRRWHSGDVGFPRCLMIAMGDLRLPNVLTPIHPAIYSKHLCVSSNVSSSPKQTLYDVFAYPSAAPASPGATILYASCRNIQQSTTHTARVSAR